jgi:hypothetical protein
MPDPEPRSQADTSAPPTSLADYRARTGRSGPASARPLRVVPSADATQLLASFGQAADADG